MVSSCCAKAFVPCCVPSGLTNYGLGTKSFLFPNFSLLFLICARYFTNARLPPVNSFEMNDLRTEELGMELA
jgi:hypothetical protein